MRKFIKLKRLFFLALAISIFVSLPLTAHAAGASPTALHQSENAVSVTTPTRAQSTPKQALFLRQVNAVTSFGRPADGTTRAQYIQLLYRAAGAPAVTGRFTFSDVAANADYADALTWAEKSGIAHRDPVGRFRPDALVTDADADDFLAQTLAALGNSAQQVANGILAAYTGKTSEKDWALTPVALLAVLDRMLNADSYAAECPSVLCAAPPDHPTTL